MIESFVYQDRDDFNLTLRVVEGDQTFSWWSGINYWDLVIHYLNHDYRAIAHDNGVMPYGIMGDAVVHSRNVPAEEWLSKQIEEDLGATDYKVVLDLIERVFLNTTFPELTASQKYYAFVESHRRIDNGITHLQKMFNSAAIMRVRYELVNDALGPAFAMNDIKSNLDDCDRGTSIIDRMFSLMCGDLLERQKGDSKLCVTYSVVFSSLHDTFIYLLHEMIKRNCIVKKCPNCNLYFVPLKRSDTIYCTRPSPQMADKTCQEYVKYAKSLAKSQTDEPTRLHRQIYNSLNNRIRRGDNLNFKLKDILKTFMIESVQWKEEVKQGTKTRDEYIIWLRSVKERKV